MVCPSYYDAAAWVTTLSSERRPVSAAESNAGDDFHFWWAANRALSLIEPGSTSRMLVVEGLGRYDDPDDEYEIVDVGEYHGGETVESVTTLVLSQLKYSTRHPGQAWTAARLCEKRRRRRDDGSNSSMRSVVGDLADTYAQLLRHHDRDEIVEKVRICLVSNQPGDSLLLASVVAAQKWVLTQMRAAQRGALLKALPEEQAAIIDKLAKAVGDRLKSREFCDFLTVLDLSQIGTLDRVALARRVRMESSKLTPDRGSDSALRLFNLVRREALPDSRRDGIRAADVLAELGVGDLLDLYPAPSRALRVVDPLPAPAARRLADTVLANLRKLVVAHGAAGAGKTTTLQLMADHLPTGSVMVLFDCFGGGEYLSSGEERHTPQRFVTQVVNDLAQRCGTPLLVQPPNVEEDLWRRLSRTLEQAAALLPSDAVLVLAVDAADNAAIAANERGDRGFLQGLVGLRLPARVVVVLTARSHRIKSLCAGEAAQVDVAPFDAATSATHLRRHRPGVSDADATEFHTRTGGNPRTQFYTLSQADKAGLDTPSLLQACRRTPEALFDDILDSALKVSGVDAGGRRWLALMLALARPVSTLTLADALDVAPNAVAAFAKGLEPGVVITDGAIQFRDEDFETHVRDRVDPQDVLAAHERLADLFLANRAEDADAAAHVADHLFNARRLDDLLQLVLEEGSPTGIADGFRREQVQGRRLDLAARAAAATGNAATAVHVAVRACDTASRLGTLTRLVESRLDLVARYADIDLLRTHALRQQHDEWLAPVHMRLAAALARNPGRHAEARTALDDAEAWLRRWMADKDDEFQHWNVDADDVAAAAEARFRLDGLDAAVTELQRWRPVEFASDSAAALVTRIGDEIGPDTVRKTLQEQRVPVAGQAPFLLSYPLGMSTDPAPGWVDEVVRVLLAADPVDFTDPVEPRPWWTRVLGTATRFGDRTAVQALAEHWASELPRHAREFRTSGSTGIAALRCHAAAAALANRDVDMESLVPSVLRSENPGQRGGSDQRTYDRREWIESVRPLAEVAVLAVRAAVGEVSVTEVMTFVDSGIAARMAKAQHRWFTYDAMYPAWAVLAAEAVADAGLPIEVYDRIADAAATLLRDGAPTLWLDLAETLISRHGDTDQAARLCVRAAQHARGGAYPAPDRLELLARAAEIAGKCSATLGENLFDQAVDAATGINDDAARLLVVHADLAGRAEIALSDRPGIATQLVRAAEAVALHATDSDVIPYAEIVGAVSRLDVGIGLATSSRWDDENRVPFVSTLSTALIGAVDGGGVPAAEALLLDHLIEADRARLEYQLAVVDRIGDGAAAAVTARRALARTTKWLRRHVPARAQASLAKRLLAVTAARGLDENLRVDLETVRRLAHDDRDALDSLKHARRRGTSRRHDAQALLDMADERRWMTLGEDFSLLTKEYVHGEELRSFVEAVTRTARLDERRDALTAVAGLPASQVGDVILPVLANCVGEWRTWPGIVTWAAEMLPGLLARSLYHLAWSQEPDRLLSQLRLLTDDASIRRAILLALPEARPRLTAHGLHNIAVLLARLCGAADAAQALQALLADRVPNIDTEHRPDATTHRTDAQPVTLLLWSAFGHPRRAIRWRAAHAARELLVHTNRATAERHAAALVRCLDSANVEDFRDPSLHFYSMSACAALLVALHRVALDQPTVLAPHLSNFVHHATRRDLPHVQIRELARRIALALADPTDPAIDKLRHTNQPSCCHADRKPRHLGSDSLASRNRRYDFDGMDTIPYWYAPVASIFDIPVDEIADRAERWILDTWGFGRDDWRTDARELRDERVSERMSHRHGSIPPEESLRLYLEHHAMMVTAGELLDTGQPIRVDTYGISENDPWGYWFAEYLPAPGPWLTDLRSQVPAEAELFGHLPPLDHWEIPTAVDHDSVFGFEDGSLQDQVLVDGHISLHRPGANSTIFVKSALVAPDHAADLQRALAAAPNPWDWKLPTEGDQQFEVNHGRFILQGWLTEPDSYREGLEKHDPYAHQMRATLPLPGQRFRRLTSTVIDTNGLALLAGNGTAVARAVQWAETEPDGGDDVFSSGYRVHIDRTALLRHLADTGMSLIVEVQIGRNRSRRSVDGYKPPRSRLYLVDASGRVVAS